MHFCLEGRQAGKVNNQAKTIAKQNNCQNCHVKKAKMYLNRGLGIEDTKF